MDRALTWAGTPTAGVRAVRPGVGSHDEDDTKDGEDQHRRAQDPGGRMLGEWATGMDPAGRDDGRRMLERRVVAAPVSRVAQDGPDLVEPPYGRLGFRPRVEIRMEFACPPPVRALQLVVRGPAGYAELVV
jgi:hypothetical protein